MRNARNTERKVNAIINEILDEEQGNDATRSACPGDCEESDNTIKETKCNCAVENSLRFSIRVMEAMRSLQRDVNQPSTSRVEDIVDYIRTNYRNNGDLDAQVRTALRQVCSQGFVMKLFDDEYHLVGPFARSTKRNGCNLDCTGRISTTIDETSRRRRSINNGCFCKHISRTPYRPSHRDPRSPHEEFLRTSDRLEDGTVEPRFHSTEILNNKVNNDYRDREIDPEIFCDCEDARDDHRQRGITKPRQTDQRDELPSPIPGPSREITKTPVPVKNARKKARLDDRTIKRADEDDEETEEDLDCTCDVIQVDQDAQLRKQVPDRIRVVRDRQNGRRHEDDEDEEEKVEEEDSEKTEEEADEKEDTDTEDSVYRQLRRRRSPRRTRARERELKRWIRRCREECERRRAR